MSVNITRGENKTFTITIRDQDGDPFDLTNFDQYKVCLPLTATHLDITEIANANGSVTTLLGSAVLGKIQVYVNYVDTALLKIGERQDIGVLLNNSTTPNPRGQTNTGVLNVKAAICS